MNEIESVIAGFGGRQFLSCYCDLCIAIEVEMLLLPDRPQMKRICEEVCCRTRRNRHAVAKSLSRAVEDLWYYGYPDIIGAYCAGWECGKPTPREFIYSVSRELKCSEMTDNEIAEYA